MDYVACQGYARKIKDVYCNGMSSSLCQCRQRLQVLIAGMEFSASTKNRKEYEYGDLESRIHHKMTPFDF